MSCSIPLYKRGHSLFGQNIWSFSSEFSDFAIGITIVVLCRLANHHHHLIERIIWRRGKLHILHMAKQWTSRGRGVGRVLVSANVLFFSVFLCSHYHNHRRSRQWSVTITLLSRSSISNHHHARIRNCVFSWLFIQ
jgi:hypothetical protein